MNNPTATQQFVIRGEIFKIDIGHEENLGIYGRQFWSAVANGDYEKTTFDFLDELNQQEFEYFIDIGAATGCMSLYASAKGLKVISIEPQAKVFEALNRNLDLNRLKSRNISGLFALVTPSHSVEDLSKSFTPGAFGPIINGALSGQTVTLNQLIEKLPIKSKVALKIDIEGAEFPLFANRETLDYLRIRKPLVYIALHPGFKKPLLGSANYFNRVFWRIQATQDVITFYSAISNLAEIQLASNRRKVNLIGLLRSLAQDKKDFLIIF